MYNIVGFQTHLRIGAEAWVFNDPGAPKCELPAVRRNAPQHIY
jgi:folate-dependent tRNA-U54 methylase TrmFO/GidA